MTLTLALCMAGGPAWASSFALVSDNGSKQVALFDADRDTVTASRAAQPGQAIGDCALNADENLGFSSASSSEITILAIDEEAGQFGGETQLVAISNLGLDMSHNPDESFLVLAGGGAIQQPLSVIDTELRVEVATAGLFADHTSVEFCGDGTLLVTTTSGRYFGQEPDNALYDATLDQQGNITLLGHRIASGAQPNNSACAPGSLTAVMLDRAGGLTSFTLPDFSVADRESTRDGAAAISATFSSDGRRLYVRTTEAVEAYDFDPVTGEMTADWTAPAPGSLAYYGMDQIALHPAGNKLYVDGEASVLILDPENGERAGKIPMSDSTGICFANTAPALARGQFARNTISGTAAP